MERHAKWIMQGDREKPQLILMEDPKFRWPCVSIEELSRRSHACYFLTTGPCPLWHAPSPPLWALGVLGVKPCVHLDEKPVVLWRPVWIVVQGHTVQKALLGGFILITPGYTKVA